MTVEIRLKFIPQVIVCPELEARSAPLYICEGKYT